MTLAGVDQSVYSWQAEVVSKPTMVLAFHLHCSFTENVRFVVYWLTRPPHARKVLGSSPGEYIGFKKKCLSVPVLLPLYCIAYAADWLIIDSAKNGWEGG